MILGLHVRLFILEIEQTIEMTSINVRFFHSFAKLNIIIQKATLFAEQLLIFINLSKTILFL